MYMYQQKKGDTILPYSKGNEKNATGAKYKLVQKCFITTRIVEFFTRKYKHTIVTSIKSITFHSKCWGHL